MRSENMRMRKHFATGAALTAAAAMILTACGGGSSTTTSTDGGSKGSDGPKGTITAGVAYETTDYGPITTSALGMGANWQVLEGLYRFNMADYSVSPALAAGDPEKISDTEYEVKLRDGAKFSDGTPVTAADFVASYERATSESRSTVSSSPSSTASKPRTTTPSRSSSSTPSPT